jgi:hypothetical protein
MGYAWVVPQAHSRVSNINFDIWSWWRGTLFIPHEKFQKEGIFLSHLGLKSNVFPESLTDLSA